MSLPIFGALLFELQSKGPLSKILFDINMLKTYEPHEGKIPFWLNEKESRVFIPHPWILELGKAFFLNPTTKLHQKIGQLDRTPLFQR